MDKLRSFSFSVRLFPADRAIAVFLKKQSIKVVWLALSAGLVCSYLFALDPRQPLTQLYHSSWNARNGLTGSVYALAQTTDGFLWVGTSDGLLRFDGLSFEQYRPEAGSLLSDSVSALMAVPDGGLWVGYARGGVSFLKGAGITNYSGSDRFPVGEVRGFAQDATGAVWAATVGGLARFEKHSWQTIKMNWNYPSKTAWRLLVDRDGTLWVAATGRIMSLPRGQRQFQDAGINTTGPVFALAQAPNGALVFFDNDRPGLSAFRHRTDGKNDMLPAADVPARTIVFDRDGSMWLGGLGLSRLPIPEGDLRSKSKAEVERLMQAQGLTGDSANSILEDREGNIWVGTDGGLDRFRYRNLSWFPLPRDKFSLVSDDHGRVWSGSHGGGPPRGIRSTDGKQVRDGPDLVYMAYRDPDSTIWFSTRDALLHWDHGKFTKIDPPEQVRELSRSSIPNDPIIISSITKDRSGRLWASFGGSGEFYLEDGAWKFLAVLPGHPDWSANYAFTDSSDRVWLAWGEKIAVLDHGNVHIFSTKSDLAVGPPNIITECNRHIWVGGESGLAFLQNNAFHTLRTADGVSFHSVNGIAVVPDGGLWLSTGLGIVHIPQSEIESSLEHYDHKASYELFDLVSDLPEQLQRGGTYSSAAVQSDDGLLWFATRGGVARVDPTHIFRNSLAPPVTIRSVIADERSYSAFTSPRLPASTRNLEIDYTALSLSVPERVRFRYKLEGLESSWNEAGPRRQAFYHKNDLGPGRYTFHVIACNNDGVWNDQGAFFNFTVAPAWYQTVWFQTLSIVACILLAWTLYRFRLRQIARALSAGFDERLAERTRIAQELHDTLLQSVLSASLQLDVAEDQLPEDSPTKPLLKRVLQLMHTVTEESRKALRGLRTTETDYQSLETAFARMRQEFRLDDKIDFRVIVDSVTRPLRPMIRDEVYRIGREALVNAFMHANAKLIEVEVEYASRHLRVLVRDDGMGIDPQILHSGREGHWGLVGIRERSKRIGATLRLRSRIGAGTEVDLTVPGSIAFEKSSSGPISRWFHWLSRERFETPKQD